MKTNKKLVAGVVAGVVALGAVCGGIGFAVAPNPVPQDVIDAQLDASYKAGVDSVEPVQLPGTIEIVEKIIEVEKVVTVEVDNANLASVLQFVYDADGNVEYVVDGLKDSEVDQIVDRIVFVNDVKALALAEVKSNLLSEVHKKVVSGEKLDKDDIERVRYNDDSDEILVDVLDFDEKDAEVIVTGTFIQDGVKYKFTSTVDIKDGEVDDSDYEVELA